MEENTNEWIVYITMASHISKVIIAFFTLVFSIYIFKVTRASNNKKERDSLRTQSLQLIIFKHNFIHLFNFYEKISKVSKVLLTKELNDDEKSELNDKYLDCLIELRLKFTDLLLIVDKGLYEQVKDNTDALVDDLTKAIYDEGLKLNIKEKYNEVITTSTSESKTKTMGIFYKFLSEH